ncbi:uncharacterized protein LOC144865656 [Branchiostoma floridae x Branchiostoma japonicum]
MADNPCQDLFLEISRNLTNEEVRDLRHYVSGTKILPAVFVQHADAHQIFNQLEKGQKLKPEDLSLLADLLRKIGRHDYAEKAEKIAEDERKGSPQPCTSQLKRKGEDGEEFPEKKKSAACREEGSPVGGFRMACRGSPQSSDNDMDSGMESLERASPTEEKSHQVLHGPSWKQKSTPFDSSQMQPEASNATTSMATDQGSDPVYTPGMARYAKLASLLIDEGTSLVRKIFEEEVKKMNPPSLREQLKKHKNRLCGLRYLSPGCRKTLYPLSGDVPDTAQEFDLFLLHLLFKELVWHELGRNALYAKSLTRLLECRNNYIAHIPSTDMLAEDFDRGWETLTEILISLGGDRERILQRRHGSIDPEQEASYLNMAQDENLLKKGDIQKYFDKVIAEVSHKWDDLARKLGFNENEIKGIETLKSDHDRRCREMLHRWLNREGWEATLQVLKQALIDVEERLVAETLDGDIQKYFDKVITKVSHKWDDLARKLGFTENEIKGIETLKSDHDRRCREMLHRWLNREGWEATLQVLKQALIDVGERLVAETLDEVSNYFLFIKSRVSSDWKDLAFNLGFATADVKNITQRNMDDESRCINMLEEWQRRTGDLATIDVLMKALSDAALLDIVDGLKKEYPELSKAPEPVASGSTEIGMTNFEGWKDWNGTLATLTVENLQCFKDRRTVDLHQETTGIIGSNSSGKTTLLRGWQLFGTLSYEMSSNSSGTQLISNSVITDIFLLSDIKDFWHRRDTEKPVTIIGRDTDGNELQFIITYVTGGTLVSVDKLIKSSGMVGDSHRPVLAVLDIVNGDAYKPQVPVKVPYPSFAVVRLDHSQVFSMLCELQQAKACWNCFEAMLESIQPGCAIRVVGGAGQRGQKEIVVREESHEISLQICDSGLLQIVSVLVFVLHSLKWFFPHKTFGLDSAGHTPIATVLLDDIGNFLGRDTFSNLSKCLTSTIKCQTVITTSSIEVALGCKYIIPSQSPSSSHHVRSPMIPLMRINTGDAAKALINIGNAWKNLGDFRNAVSYFERSLQMMKTIYGQKSHPDIAESLDNLGAAWSHLSDHRRAARYFLESLQMRQRVHGKDNPHPDIAKSLDNMGNAWKELGDSAKAISYYEQSLQMMQNIYGKETAHPDIAGTLNSLGVAWSHLGDHIKAVNYYEQTLKMRRAIYGQDTPHPAIVQTLDDLSTVYSDLGDDEHAYSYRHKAQEMKMSMCGEDTAHLDL